MKQANEKACVCLCVCVGRPRSGVLGSATQGTLPGDVGDTCDPVRPPAWITVTTTMPVSVCVCLCVFVNACREESCLFFHVFQHFSTSPASRTLLIAFIPIISTFNNYPKIPKSLRKSPRDREVN